jgi:hypothetical protein
MTAPAHRFVRIHHKRCTFRPRKTVASLCKSSHRSMRISPALLVCDRVPNDASSPASVNSIPGEVDVSFSNS